MKHNFFTNLKQLRLEAGLTQQQLAQKLNMTQRKVSYLENGTVHPDLDTLVAIAEFFDISVDILLDIQK